MDGCKMGLVNRGNWWYTFAVRAGRMAFSGW